MDEECDNFAQGFNKCITRDMKGKPMQDFDFNGYGSKNLACKSTVPSSAITVEKAFQDTQRLFYDVSTVPNIIDLTNQFMATPAICEEEGYHFYFVSNLTNTSSDVIIRFKGTGVLEGFPVVGGDGNPLQKGALVSQSIHSCVVYFKSPVFIVAIISIGSGGGGGGGGQVDSIDSDYTIEVDNKDPVRPQISVNVGEVLEGVVMFVNGKPPSDEVEDGGNVLVADGHPVGSINGHTPDFDTFNIDNVVMQDTLLGDISIPYTDLQKTFDAREKVLNNIVNVNVLQSPQSPIDLKVVMSTIGGSGGYHMTFSNPITSSFNLLALGGITHGRHTIEGISFASFELDNSCSGGSVNFSGNCVVAQNPDVKPVINVSGGIKLVVSNVSFVKWTGWQQQPLFRIDGGTLILTSSCLLPDLPMIPDGQPVDIRNGGKLIICNEWKNFDVKWHVLTDKTGTIVVNNYQIYPNIPQSVNKLLASY
jgi:hypothetical protein